MTMFNKVSKTFQWGQHTVTMETGEIARQSGGAVLLDMDGTVVLATVVASRTNGKAGARLSPTDGGLPRKSLCRRQDSRQLFQA
jgi:polyribonucleotide nucleotidyltransferase